VEDVAAVRAAFRQMMDAKAAGREFDEIRTSPVRTEVPCRNAAAVCVPEVIERLEHLRARAISRMREAFGAETLYPNFTLLSEMRVGDRHTPHADAERQTTEGWVPNHTSWRTHVGLLYLNSSGVDYEGGQLRLTCLDVTITPASGMFVAFPAGRRHVHEVTRIEAGQRLSLAIWLTGEPERAECWHSEAKHR
jgi:predicted 2-oxoglutarate/Fe(II)-dependent dioxygenase YbiX